MFGLSIEKLFLIAICAAVIIGPARLPYYTRRVAELVRGVRDYLESARGRVEEEAGVVLSEQEWRSLDPRQYDPRRIFREALTAPAAAGAAVAATVTNAADSAATTAAQADPTVLPAPSASTSPQSARPVVVPAASSAAAMADHCPHCAHLALAPTTEAESEPAPPSEPADTAEPDPPRKLVLGVDYIIGGTSGHPRRIMLPRPTDTDGVTADRPVDRIA